MLKGRGNARQHRLPDPPLDLRSQGRAARRAAFRRQAVPQPRPIAAAELERAAVRRHARRRAATSPDVARSTTSISRATCSTASRSTSAITTGRSFIEVYLEDYHVVPFHPGPRPLRHLRRPRVAVRRLALGADGRHQQRARQAGHARPTRAGTRRSLDFYRGEIAAARRDLDGLLPEHHDRVVSARARRQHADPARRRPHDQRRRVLLSRGDRAVRARVRRGRAGRLHGDGDRGRRDRRADGRRPQRALPRRAAARKGRTSRRWKTACSTSTNSCGANSTRTSRRADAAATARASSEPDRHVHTLISTADLAARLGATRRSSSSTSGTISGSRIPGARPSTGARTFRARGSRTSTATCRRRRRAATAVTRCPSPRSLRGGVRPARHRRDEAGRRLRSGQRRVRGAAVVDAALARARCRRRARRRLRRMGARRPPGHRRRRSVVPPTSRSSPRPARAGRRRRSVVAANLASRVAARDRRARPRALSRRRRADRSGRRSHPRRDQPAVHART